MLIVHAKSGDVICLGREGENLARQVVFDIYEWQEMYGEGTVQLLAQRMGDAAPYPCVIEMDGNHAVWTITSADTARPGKYGKCELSYFMGETLVKSETFVTIVLDALGEPTEDPPESYQAWVNKVLVAGANAEAAADRAETAAVRQPIIGENGNWWVWGMDAGKYVDTGVVAEATQDDWEQNDASKPDHIKNRPFYEEVLEAELLPPTVAECAGEMDNCAIYVDFTLVSGETYIVTLDGTKYECVATKGCALLFGDFAVENDEGGLLILWSGIGPVTVTLSISHITNEVKKIDPKYLDMDAIKAALPTVELTATLEDGTTQTYKLYGEAVTE